MKRVGSAVLRVLLVAGEERLPALSSMLRDIDVGVEVVLPNGAWPEAGSAAAHASDVAEAGIAETPVVSSDVALPDVVLLDLEGEASEGQYGRLPGHLADELERSANTPLTELPMLALVATDEMGRIALQGGLHGYLVASQLSADLFLHVAHHAIALGQASQELKRAREGLIHSDRLASIGQLTAGVVHEINNPAATLLANLTVIKKQLERADGRLELDNGYPNESSEPAESTESVESAEPAEPADWIDIVDESIAEVGRIRSIVRDLRNFSRVDSGAIGLIDLNRVIDDACRLTEGLIRHRARLTRDLRAEFHVRGNYGKLVQVFTNLLTNAAQAIVGLPAENRIHVSTTASDDLVVAVIEDTGSGIPESARELIFEPFFTTKPKDIGNGLGLTLSAEIIHSHGGEIDFAPREGGGTRFEVRMAAAPTSRRATDRDAHSPTPSSGDRLVTRRETRRWATGTSEGPLRVLLIDDEKSLLRAFRRLLAPRYEVVTAGNGQQALDILAQDMAFDAIVCDFAMPDVDGIAIYEVVAQRERDTADRIVFCTGGPVSPRGRAFIESTSNVVLEKPVPPELLLITIDRLGKR